MRRFLVTAFVGVVLFAAVAWATGLYRPYTPPENKAKKPTKTDPKSQVERAKQRLGDPGPRLYQGPRVDNRVPPRKESGNDPIIIANGHLAVPTNNKLDVPVRVDGKLLCVGRPIAEKDRQPGDVPVPTLQGGKKRIVYYRQLQEGAFVSPNEIVAVIDPILALNQVALKDAKLGAAKADKKAADALQKYYEAEYLRAKGLHDKGKGYISEAEYQIAVAQWLKADQDMASKREAVTVADRELDEAKTLLDFHYLRNVIPANPAVKTPYQQSIIKTVVKSPGEAVKNQDAILQIHNIARLRAEGLVDVQFLRSLQRGMEVEVYPTIPREPLRTFVGHRGAINAVAVSGDDKEPLIISASEDSTVRVWQRKYQDERCVWYHQAPVRAVACTPPGAKHNYCLTGCADGTVRLYDLDKLDSKPLVKEAMPYKDPINCLAFSPDGQWFATGTESGAIALWDPEADQTWAKEPKPKYTFHHELSHLGAVTSLYFTPDLQIVSAGRDNTLRVWTLYKKAAQLNDNMPLTERSGRVTNLGISPDGKYMLFDQEKRLQVMSVRDGRTIGEVKDLSTPTPFERFAIFSPDGSLILTGSSSEGRIQLWRAPTGKARMHEVREFIPRGASSPTCAAFGEDKKLAALATRDTRGKKGTRDADRVFAVTGTREGSIHLWAVPPKKLVDQTIIGKITFVDSTVEASTRQARVWVDFNNDNGELRPNETVTGVVPR
jgi:multidrug efflux pump subunit AcrA (membrane-fusion protein)